MPVSTNLKRFVSLVSYFGKRQDEQDRQEMGYPAVVSESAFELSLCVLHALTVRGARGVTLDRELAGSRSWEI